MLSLRTSQSCFESVELVLASLVVLGVVVFVAADSVSSRHGFFSTVFRMVLVLLAAFFPVLFLLNLFFGFGVFLFLDGLRCVHLQGVTLPNVLEVLAGAAWAFGGVFVTVRYVRKYV